MTNTNAPQKRDLQYYSTEAIPEGFYIDHNTGETFASVNLLAWMVAVPVDSIYSFIESEPDLLDAIEMEEDEEGSEFMLLYPEHVIRKAVEKYAPELVGRMEKLGLREVIHRMSGFDEVFSTEMCLLGSDEPQTHWTLYEWMVENCHIVLEARLFHKFISKVHPMHRKFYPNNPKTEYRQQVNNPKQVKQLRVYSRAEFPILQMCYTQTLIENCFK